MEGTGINRLVCRKAIIFTFVALGCVALQASFYGLLVVLAGGGSFGARGNFQRPLVQLCWPVMIIFPSLIILTLYLEKIAAQLSLRICLIDIRDPVLRLLKT